MVRLRNHDLARYAMCWWRQSEVLAGPFGQRDSQVIRSFDEEMLREEPGRC